MITIKEFFDKVTCTGHFVVKERVNGFWVPLGGGSPDVLAKRYPDKEICAMYSAEGVIFLLVD